MQKRAGQIYIPKQPFLLQTFCCDKSLLTRLSGKFAGTLWRNSPTSFGQELTKQFSTEELFIHGGTRRNSTEPCYGIIFKLSQRDID